jgi:hypothetical protein
VSQALRDPHPKGRAKALERSHRAGKQRIPIRVSRTDQLARHPHHLAIHLNNVRHRLPLRRAPIAYGLTVANIEGKATAITVITPVKRGGPLLLWLVFWAGRNMEWTLKKLQTLSFIHFARWAVIKRFPDGREGERLNHTYLLFESNFNGAWEQYIDAFSEVVALRMKAIWGTSLGFPGPLPVEPFKGYIRRNEFVANHYYSAYPGATTTEIVSAARVEAALEELARTSAGLDPDSFGEAYASFLTKLQRDL